MADQTRAITRTAGFALVLAVVLAVASAWRGAHLRRSVKAGLSGVLAHLDRIRSGNLDPVEPLRGPLELALIDAGIGATAQELRAAGERSEEHTSELQSLMRISYAVFCLKKKTNNYINQLLYSTQTTTPKQYI